MVSAAISGKPSTPPGTTEAQIVSNPTLPEIWKLCHLKSKLSASPVMVGQRYMMTCNRANPHLWNASTSVHQIKASWPRCKEHCITRVGATRVQNCGCSNQLGLAELGLRVKKRRWFYPTPGMCSTQQPLGNNAPNFHTNRPGLVPTHERQHWARMVKIISISGYYIDSVNVH